LSFNKKETYENDFLVSPPFVPLEHHVDVEDCHVHLIDPGDQRVPPRRQLGLHVEEPQAIADAVGAGLGQRVRAVALVVKQLAVKREEVWISVCLAGYLVCKETSQVKLSVSNYLFVYY